VPRANTRKLPFKKLPMKRQEGGQTQKNVWRLVFLGLLLVVALAFGANAKALLMPERLMPKDSSVVIHAGRIWTRMWRHWKRLLVRTRLDYSDTQSVHWTR